MFGVAAVKRVSKGEVIDMEQERAVGTGGRNSKEREEQADGLEGG
jgi:hypothetical protein